MAHGCWISPYTFLVEQPLSEVDRSAWLLGYYAAMHPTTREVQFMLWSCSATAVDAEGIPTGEEGEDVGFLLCCN